MSDLDGIEFSEEDIVEIDFSSQGFVLRSPEVREEWQVVPEDPETEPTLLPTDRSEYPINVFGVSITIDDYETFEEIRRS